MFSNIYKNRRVLVTGHTGFKGSWLSAWLLELGARVSGYSLGIPTVPSHFGILGLKKRMEHQLGDIRERNSLAKAFAQFEPEIVFHLAAQAIVRTSYEDPVLTFATNAGGTLNLLDCIRTSDSVQAGVIITSDKCYENLEWVWGYRENDRLGGKDPYSASKACAEQISHAFMQSYFQTDGPHIATARAGNVIGGGDWAPDRVVPDCMRAWSKEAAVVIRNPNATRPWQHVLEPVSGYLCLGERLLKGERPIKNQAFNFGPQAQVNQSVGTLISELGKFWNGARWETKPAEGENKPESTLLKLNCDKALHSLDWQAALPFEETVRLTGTWYRNYYETGDSPMAEVTRSQIEHYVSHARKLDLPWSR